MCKQERIIPISASVKLSLKGKDNKLKHGIARIIMEDEIRYIHQQKQKLKKDITGLNIQLKSVLRIMIQSVLIYKVNLAVKKLI